MEVELLHGSMRSLHAITTFRVLHASDEAFASMESTFRNRDAENEHHHARDQQQAGRARTARSSTSQVKSRFSPWSTPLDHLKRSVSSDGLQW